MTTRPDPFAPLVAALQKPSAGSSDFDLNPDVVLPADRTSPEDVLPIDAVVPAPEDFTGGKVDAGDADVTAAALREAHEEIGLTPDNVEVLGTLPGHETVTSFAITPVLGRIRADFDPIPEPGEVAEVFTVPLSHVTNPANFSVQHRRWRGQRRYYYTVPYGPYYIWGATARILRGLAERLST